MLHGGKTEQLQISQSRITDHLPGVQGFRTLCQSSNFIIFRFGCGYNRYLSFCFHP